MSIKGFHLQKFGRRQECVLQIFTVNGHLGLTKCALGPSYNDLKYFMKWLEKKLQPFLLVCQLLDWHPSQGPLKLLWATTGIWRMSLFLRRYLELVSNWEKQPLFRFVHVTSILEMNLGCLEEFFFSVEICHQ